jgi:ankyrin repeat protein
MKASDFIQIATQGDAGAARAAVASDPRLARSRNHTGVSVIVLAVYAGRLDLAREIASAAPSLDIFEASCIGGDAYVEGILQNSPELVNSVSPDGFSPLGFAAFFGHLKLLEVLLRHDADVNMPARNAMEVRPLHSAAAHSDQSQAAGLARPLLEAGAEPNAKQQGGYAPLHEAAFNGNLELVRLLLQYGADPKLPNDDGESPISIAESNGHAEVARVLILHAA